MKIIKGNLIKTAADVLCPAACLLQKCLADWSPSDNVLTPWDDGIKSVFEQENVNKRKGFLGNDIYKACASAVCTCGNLIMRVKVRFKVWRGKMERRHRQEKLKKTIKYWNKAHLFFYYQWYMFIRIQFYAKKKHLNKQTIVPQNKIYVL